MKLLSVIIKTLLALFLLVALLVAGRGISDAQVDYDVPLSDTKIPQYEVVEIPFDQNNDFTAAHPFAAGAVIDLDNDGVEEVFLGGGPGQTDALLKYVNGEFRIIPNVWGITKSDTSASFGASVIDTDGDGRSDLIVSRTDGVWLHRNLGGTFTNEKLPLNLPSDTTPLSVAIADLNRDGLYDLYVAGYIRQDLVEGQNIFNKKGYGGSSRLYINTGNNSFRDATEESGLSYKHNTFMGIFVDVDQDNFADLVVAHDTGQVRTWRNQGDGTFVNRLNPNSNEYSYPMGIGIGDYNNNDLVDFVFSNVGSTPPDFMIRGDLNESQISNWKWLLFENLGDFSFRESGEKAKIANYEFSWGVVMEDLNLDGREDLIVSENYIGLPPHKIPFLRSPGRLLIQNEAGMFAAVGKQANVVNKRYSISPLLADFNGDGYPDIIHVNISGRSKAFISKGGNTDFLKIVLPNLASSIAATVKVEFSDGSTKTKFFISGEGLCSDSSHTLIFGLEDKNATVIRVTYLDGTQQEYLNPTNNQTVRF